MRALGAAALFVPIGVIMLFTYPSVRSYAVHLCGWPARMDCSIGSPWWVVVKVGLLGMFAIAVFAIARWVWTARGWGFVVAALWWWFFFPIVVLAVGPRRINLANLVILATYACLGVELARRVVRHVIGRWRRYADRLAIALIVVIILMATQVPRELERVFDLNW